MSLSSAEQFAAAVTANPALLSEVTAASHNKTDQEAASAVAAIAAREGFDFSPAEALEVRNLHVRQLSESELDAVAGGGTDPILEQTLTSAGTILGGQVVTGGGAIGAGVGAGIATAIGGGSTEQSVVAGAQAANQSINNTKSVVQQIFSGW